MAKITLNLTEDHLRLIKNIQFHKLNNDYIGIDPNSVYGGTFVMEDVALCIGKFDQYIKGTEEDYDGRKYPQELEDYMWELHSYIWDNLEYIESLVHQFITEGGLTPGKYVCKDYEKYWKKIG